jgi:pyruvate,orthophosphate dikinase
MVRAEGCVDEGDLDGEALERLAAQYAELPAREGSGAIPAEPMDQLVQAALAVFRSWEGHKARDYRRLNGLDGLAGTAVTVQQMVFGNGGPRSGSGVAFSRDPATGAKGLYVDFLFDAQGEDVVSGRRTPAGIEALASRLPSVATALTQGAARLEQAFGDAQDVEFTVEDGELYFLQTRAAKRTPRAALRIAVDLVREGMIDEAEALARLDGVDLACTAVTRFAEPAEAVARGVPAAPGVASGRVAFNVAAAQRLAETGDPVILIRREPATEDIAGFAAAAGILTAVGGRTAHAAVVARQMARACVVGCAGLAIDEAAGSASLAGRRIAAGDWISLDGESGEVSLGRRQIVSDAPAVELATVAAWRAARSDCTGAPAGETQAGQPAALSQ